MPKMVFIKCWILKVSLATILFLLLSAHGTDGDDIIVQAESDDTPAVVKDNTSPDVEEPLSSDAIDTTAPENKETTRIEEPVTTTPHVPDTTTPVDTDTTPEAKDTTTTPEFKDTTTPGVTGTPTPQVTDTTPPEVTGTTTMEIIDSTRPEITGITTPTPNGTTTELIGNEYNTTNLLNETTTRPKGDKGPYACLQEVMDACTDEECECLRDETPTATEDVPCENLRYEDEVTCKTILLKCALDNGCSADIRPYVA